MNGTEIEKAAAYLMELNDRGTKRVEMFRLCAEKFPDMKRSDFTLAIQIAMHDIKSSP